MSLPLRPVTMWSTSILASEMQFVFITKAGPHRYERLRLCLLAGWIIFCHVLGCMACCTADAPAEYLGDSWVGERTRIGSTIHTAATVSIRALSAGGFTFEIHAQSGAHIGYVTGAATLIGHNKAVFVGENGCVISFVLQGDILGITTSQGCMWYGGVGVHFDGKYRNDVEIVKPSLSDKGIFVTKSQEEAFRELTGSAYPLFLENAHLVFTGEDLDGVGATVYELGIRGLLGFMGAIIMVGQDGEVWAAVTDGDILRYFTTEIPASKLPQTIGNWSARFAGKHMFLMNSNGSQCSK